MMTKNVKVALIALFCLVFVRENMAGVHFEDEFDADDPITRAFESQITDDKETEELEGDSIKFRSYCIESRDRVLDIMSKEKNELYLRIFILIITTAYNFGQDEMQLYEDAARLLVSRDQSNISKAENPIVRAIHAEGAGKPVFEKVLAALDAPETPKLAPITSELHTLHETKAYSDQDVLAVDNGCSLVLDAVNQIGQMFDSFKKEMVNTDPSVLSINAKNLQCRTSISVFKSENLCKIIKEIVHSEN